ncbi:MAG: hypothetical protein RL141_833 [Candidatus Parcubacteria bacterium]
MCHADALPGANDFARSLSPAGRETAQAVGALWQREGFVPDTVIVSRTIRAIETAVAVCPEGVTINLADALYFGKDPEWREQLLSGFERLPQNATLSMQLADAQLEPIINAYGAAAARYILGQLKPDDRRVAVVGHAAFLPITIWYVSGKKDSTALTLRIAKGGTYELTISLDTERSIP